MFTISRLFKKRAAVGALGLEISPFGYALARVYDAGEGERHCECHYIEGTDIEVLADYVKQREYQHMPLHAVLHPTMYDINFMDRPEVEDDELADALRWKLKDIIETSVNDLIVCAFAVPDDAYRGLQKKAYAVSMHKELLDGIVQDLQKLDVEIQSIGIGELHDRNIVALTGEEMGGTGLLHLRSSHGSINLSQGENLYLTRAIDTGQSAFEGVNDSNRQQLLDSLLLQIQRSFDFYESQLSKGLIRRMLIAPTRVNVLELDAYLQTNLGVQVEKLDLNKLFSLEQPLGVDQQSLCFSSVAAACEGSAA